MMNENEQENEKRETVADILAEMFKFSDKRIEEGRDHAMTSESVGLVVHQLAKRFEAAWTREREELDKRISDLEAYAKLWTGRADELRLKCDELYAKAKPVGNAAALREALVAVQKKIEYLCGSFNVPNSLVAGRMEINGIINAALSAPARNCDLPLVVDGPADNNADKAWLVFKHHNPDAYFDVSGLLRCIDWLLAPAAERKGE